MSGPRNSLAKTLIDEEVMAMGSTTPESEDITFKVDSSVAYVGLARNKNKNALTVKMITRLTQIAEELSGNRAVRCVILHGKLDAFSAGIDLKDPQRWDLENLDAMGIRRLSQLGPTMCRIWENLPQITIAAIEGFNVGAGIALTLACDFRVQAKNAFLSIPEIQIGVPLGWQSIPRLIRLIGPSRTKQALLLGERLSAATAHEWGLVDFLVESGDAFSKAEEIAKKISAMPPFAVVTAKESINAISNALNHVGSFMDLDLSTLAVVSGQMNRSI